jgi:uncharacterized membrane protein (UPF0127 family)
MQIRAALAALLVAAACGGSSRPVALIASPGGTVEVALEVADTPERQQRGLMYRSALADGHGMLFVFDEDVDHTFWMKNTLIPLDLLFIGADGRVVGVHAEATPLSTASIAVGTPSRFVLEVPGGYAARHGIASGARVEFRGVRLP